MGEEWKVSSARFNPKNVCSKPRATIAQGEPCAASYQRIRSEFPQLMDRLHNILLPIQHEIFGDWARWSLFEDPCYAVR
jgi:hypothetical protein